MTIEKIKGRYYVKVWRNGEYFRGPHGFDKEKDAEQCEAEIKAGIRMAQPEGPGPKYFFDCWVHYLDHCEVYNSKRWYETKRWIGEKFFSKWFKRPVSSITVAEIDAHLIERRKVSARTGNLDFEILRNFFKFCEQRGYIQTSPFRRGQLKKFPMRVKQRVPFSTEETYLRMSEGKRSTFDATLHLYGGPDR